MKRAAWATASVIPTPVELLALIVGLWFAVYVAGPRAGLAVGAVGAAVMLASWRRTRRGAQAGRGVSSARLGWAIGAALFAVVLPGVAKSTFAVSLMDRALVVSLIVLSLNLVTGYTGQISIGHAALLGIGAYAAAIATGQGHLSIVLAVAIGAAATAAVGLLIGVPALRLRGHYLGLVTLAITVAFPEVLQVHELEKYTGSFNGLSEFSRAFGPPVSWHWLTSERWHYFVGLLVLLVAIWLVSNLVRSAAGRALTATRDDENAATAMGVDIALVKISAFVVSAALAGVAGGLWFLLNNRSVAPDGFTLTQSIEFLLAMVIGGRASILGSILGGFFLVYIYQQGVQAFSSAFQSGSRNWADVLVVALITVLVLLWFSRRSVLPRTTRSFMARPASPVTRAGLVTGAVVVAAVIAVGVLAGLRFITSTFLNVVALQPAFAGAAVLLVVLAMPGGLAGFTRDLDALSWAEVGEWLHGRIVPGGVGADEQTRGVSRERERVSSG